MLLALALALTAVRGTDLPAAVCVVSPRVEALSQGDARGELPLPAPVLVVIEPLEELRIERGGMLVWRREARGDRPLPGPLAWPVAPVQPGEAVLLRLRPQRAAPGSFANVELIGAKADRMKAAVALVLSLGSEPAAWAGAIEAALVAGDVPLAWALLFHPHVPADPELQALQTEVIQRGCGD